MNRFIQDVMPPFFVIIAIVTLFIIGVKGLLKAQHKSDVATVKDAAEYCSYMSFDGHEYVKYERGLYMAGFTHSPRCGCLTNSAVKVER